MQTRRLPPPAGLSTGKVPFVAAVDTPVQKIRLGVSACLLGEPVRFDGGHKRDTYLIDTLGAVVEWVPVCPEMAAGLPTPRSSLRLVRKESNRLIARDDSDHTTAVETASERITCQLRAMELCGFVVKSKSPSCGLLRVPVYDEHGNRGAQSTGVFTGRLRSALPHHGFASRGVPLALIEHHSRELEVSFIAQQTYLRPYPKELGMFQAV